MINVGIIGSGFIGPAHLEALRRLGDVEVVALCDSRLEAAQRKARALNIAHAYDSVEALLAHPGLQVVHNCTPNHLHAQINRQIQKIIAIAPADSRRLIPGTVVYNHVVILRKLFYEPVYYAFNIFCLIISGYYN